MTLPGGPTKIEARGLDGVRKIGVLGKEAVTWMHRVRFALARGREDRGDGEIGFRGLGRTDVHRVVGKLHGERIGVGVAVRLDGPDPEFARGPDDPDRDFAAIGYQERLDGRHGVDSSPRRQRSADPP